MKKIKRLIFYYLLVFACFNIHAQFDNSYYDYEELFACKTSNGIATDGTSVFYTNDINNLLCEYTFVAGFPKSQKYITPYCSVSTSSNLDAADGKVFYLDRTTSRISCISRSGSTWNQQILPLNPAYLSKFKYNPINNEVYYIRNQDKRIAKYALSSGDEWVLNWDVEALSKNGSGLAFGDSKVFYIGSNNNLHTLEYTGGSSWAHYDLGVQAKVGKGLIYKNGHCYFVRDNGLVCRVDKVGSDFFVRVLRWDYEGSAYSSTGLAFGNDNLIYYVGYTDHEIRCLSWEGVPDWETYILNIEAPGIVSTSDLVRDNNGRIYYSSNNKLHTVFPVNNSIAFSQAHFGVGSIDPNGTDEFNSSSVSSIWNISQNSEWVGGKNSDSLPYFYFEPNNVIPDASKGLLKLKTDKIASKPVNIWPYGTLDLEYTAGQVISKTPYTEGYFEARMRMPLGHGAHPAFWLFGSNAGSDEFDIMEAPNLQPDLRHKFSCGTHRKDASNNEIPPIQGLETFVPDDQKLNERFYTFAAKLTSSEIVYYLNNKEIYRVSNLFHGSDMNIQLTGAWTACCPPDASHPATLPGIFEIDYIRTFNISATKSGNKDVFEDRSKSYIKKTTENNFMNIYPNPNNGNFVLTLSNNTPSSVVQIVDMFGRVVFQSEISGSQFEIELQNISKGIHFVKISNINGSYIEKMMVE